MSTHYRSADDVPTEVIAARLDELATAVTQRGEAMERELTMRVPAELDRDADLVMTEAAKRLRALAKKTGAEPVAPKCPDCGKALQFDAGDPATRSHPGQRACWHCADCGTEHDLLQPVPVPDSGHSARAKREAFDWLQELANSDKAPAHARVALEEWHALASVVYADLIVAGKALAAAPTGEGRRAIPNSMRTGCPDLDPEWPDDNGRPRGPRLCISYPRCSCGEEDAAPAGEGVQS